MVRFLFLILISIFVSPYDNAIAQDGGEALTFRLLSNSDQATLDLETICCDKSFRGVFGKRQPSVRTQYGNKPFWIKLEGISGEGLIQFRPILDEVVLYARTQGQTDWQIVRTGDTIANSKKTFATPFMALPLPHEVDTKHVYARINQPVIVSIDAQFWTLPPFIAMQEVDRTIKMFLLGFITSIILYNLIVSLLVRDPAFLFNATVISALLITSLYLSGYGVAYIWAPWFANSNWIFIISVWLGIVSGAMFFYAFLKVPEKPHRQYWLLFVAPTLSTILALLFLIVQAPYWMIHAAMLGCTGLIFLCVFPVVLPAALANEKRAQIILFPLFLAMIPGLALLALNKLTGLTLLNLGNNGMEITLAMEAVLFSLALASRIRLSETASQEASQRLLEVRERSSAMALSAQDRERKRLATELHDGVGQEMLVAVSHLKRLAKNPPPAQFSEVMTSLANMMSNVMNNLRRISRDMHPASIEHLGLIGTIEGLTDQFNQSGSIEFEHALNVDGRGISQEAQLHLVRVLQECLSNVAKHSGATRCQINMHRENDVLHINIEDDGIGIENNDSQDTNYFGLGMTSIDERVRGLGGQWNMISGPAGGLITNIMIPISHIVGAREGI